jgi:LysR family glycine cleavage system transcriptional activator
MLPDPKDPSYLGALVYFHHAAESLSFSRAARTLNVTPSAVSHRITALETAIGKRLFERRVREVRLTQDGAELARATAAIWEELTRITRQMASQQVLRISVGPYLSSQWLLPRIGEFEARHPGLRVDLVHVIGQPDTRLVDVSVIWAEPDSLSDHARLLFDTKAIPVAAPGLRIKETFWEETLPPIHYRDRSTWRHWLRAVGAPTDFAERGEVLEEPHMVLEAAAYRRGIAIGFLPFIDRFLDQGRLVRVGGHSIRSNRGYFLQLSSDAGPMAEAFANWVADEASEMLVHPS